MSPCNGGANAPGISKPPEASIVRTDPVQSGLAARSESGRLWCGHPGCRGLGRPPPHVSFPAAASRPQGPASSGLRNSLRGGDGAPYAAIPAECIRKCCLAVWWAPPILGIEGSNSSFGDFFRPASRWGGERIFAVSSIFALLGECVIGVFTRAAHAGTDFDVEKK